MLKIPNLKLKTNLIHYIIIGTLILLLFLTNFSIVSEFLGRFSKLSTYQKEVDEFKKQIQITKEKNLALEFDRIRIEDVSNLLLALQDFNFETNSFPLNLDELKEKKYLAENKRLTDPETNQPYFYKKREEDFVLCVWLSDMIKGVNTIECPASSAEAAASLKEPTPPDFSQPTKKEIEIFGNATVNVREKPTTDSEIVTKVLLGEHYSFIDAEGDWYYILVSAEKRGWVNKNYARPIIEN